MNKIFFRLEDVRNGRLIIDDIPLNVFMVIQNELKNDGSIKTTALGKMAKFLRLSDSTYVVHSYTLDQDYIKSNKLAKNETEIMLNSAKKIDADIQLIKDRADSQNKRLIHNLKSLTAKISQEIFYVAMQSKLMVSHKEAIGYLTTQITKQPQDAAKALLAILRYSTAQNTEFVAFQKLNGDIGMLKKEHHKIHKILMSVFYIFFQDFTDKQVRINVDKCELEGNFDYDSIHVCIYHIIENAAKYIKNGGAFDVSISKTLNELNIVFDMESLTVRDDEVKEIFSEGFSGKSAKDTQLNGNGIGLFVAKRMAEMNSGSLVMLNGRPQQMNPKYARNTFTLTLLA
jgi:signal transduction histidine kinase